MIAPCILKRHLGILLLVILSGLLIYPANAKSFDPERLGELAAQLDYCGLPHLSKIIQQENYKNEAFSESYSDSQIDEVQIIMGIIPEVDCDKAENLFLSMKGTEREGYIKKATEAAGSAQKNKEEKVVQEKKIVPVLQPNISLVKRAKEALQILGFYHGERDSFLGVKVRIAIRKWQKREGIEETGNIQPAQVAAMERDAIWYVTELEREQKRREERRVIQQAEKKRAEEQRAKIKREQEEKRMARERQRLEEIRRAKVVHDFAVIVGNRDYSGRTHSVDFAQNDADAMRQFLVNDVGFMEGNIIDLRNATKAQMEEVFGSVQSFEGRLYDLIKKGESDIVVFYSGHGVPGLRDGRGYLLPVDANPNKAELTGYPLDTFLQNLSKTGAKSVRVFIDACFSGDSHSGMIIRRVSGLTVNITTPKAPDGNMLIITASKRNQFASWDEEARHGLFTNHLLRALKGAADTNYRTGNRDGKVTVRELKAYLDQEMTYQARKKYSRDQQADVTGNLDSIVLVD